MTITSLGGIGGSFFTPIINYPEVAILGIGKSEKMKMVFRMVTIVVIAIVVLERPRAQSVKE